MITRQEIDETHLFISPAMHTLHSIGKVTEKQRLSHEDGMN